ncbi:hypothetical protein SAY87_022861 [Trapa incisa]|uniref:Ubiquitin-like domain-containing protein n=1 Tax=Trapa incisa TaxID=236973 RepID=A0AAN7KAW7_9MYRT|nr:hypothetical protein SAY87_022861 [Trapa incisa]
MEIDIHTIHEIKQKIETLAGIPVSGQTLVFNGQVLKDEDGMAFCLGIREGSRIQLLSHTLGQAMVAEAPPAARRSLRLRIKAPSSPAQFIMEVDGDETVRRLKERIQEREMTLPGVDRLVLQLRNKVLPDDISVSESDLVEDEQVDVFITPSLSPAARWGARGGIVRRLARGGGGGGGIGSNASGNELTVKVMPWEGQRKVHIEVNKFMRAGVLRAELERRQATEGFQLPADYFFIHNQVVMEEDRTFVWHEVNQGDTIDVFRGKITL